MSSSPDEESIFSTPCLARGIELDAMRSHFDLAMSGQSCFCVVSGQAGSGKSTLLRAFVSALDSSALPAVIAWGRCDPLVGTISPLAPWAQILQSLSGFSDVAIPEERLHDRNTVLQSLQGALRELAPDIIELLIPGVGLAVKSAKLLRRSALMERLSSKYTRPEEIAVAADRSRLQDQYTSIIERVSDKSPLVIVIDDLDYADEASLHLLAHLAGKTAGRRILFLVAGRDTRNPSEFNKCTKHIASIQATLTLDLDQVCVERGEQFVAEYTQRFVPGVGEGFVQELTRHTGGQPLFVAELVAHLCKLGSITFSRDRWKVSPQLDWKRLPSKIETILADQLQDLDDELRDILQAGSIEGDQFSIEVVAAALEKSPVLVARALARRAPRNLVAPLRSELLGHGRVSLFRFSHSLARQYIYDSVDPVERVYLHRSVATQLEALAAGRPEKTAAQLAYQFDRGQVHDKALQYYEMAAATATSTCALLEAIAHLQRALSLCSSKADRMRITYQLAKLQMMTGDNRAGAALMAEARSIAEQEQAPELALILADEALALARNNELDTASRAAAAAETLAREHGNDFGLLSALQTLAHIYSRSGRNEEALATQLSALPLAERLGIDHITAESLSKLGIYLKELGRYEEARDALHAALVMQLRDQPNYAQLAATRNALADMYINLGNYPEAREHLLLAVEHWRQFDRNADVAVGLTSLANLANREGMYEEALDYGHQAYEEDIAALGIDHPDLAFSLTCIGESLLGLRDYGAAIEYLDEAYQLRREKGARRGNLAWSGWLLGRALVEFGSDVGRGHRLIEEARAVLTSMGAATRSEVSEIDAWMARNTD